MLKKIFIVSLVGMFLVGCAGRAPNPVVAIQPTDASLTCNDIKAEIFINNAKIENLAKEKGWKTTQNVAAGVAGVFIPIIWFGMDFQGTQTIETQALQARQIRLANLVADKGCK